MAVPAFDLGSGRELDIYDATWNRTSRGDGCPTLDLTYAHADNLGTGLAALPGPAAARPPK